MTGGRGYGEFVLKVAGEADTGADPVGRETSPVSVELDFGGRACIDTAGGGDVRSAGVAAGVEVERLADGEVDGGACAGRYQSSHSGRAGAVSAKRHSCACGRHCCLIDETGSDALGYLGDLREDGA